MAGWQEVLFGNDFRVTVSSRSWWRWRWAKLRHIPYFVGDRPRFAFQVEAPDQDDDHAYWALYTGGSLVERDTIYLPSDDITMPMLATSGEYTIAIGMEPFVFEAAPLEQETVAYSFSVVTREGFVVKLLVPALFGIVTLTIGALNLLN